MNKRNNVPVNPTYHEVVNDYAKKWEESKSERYKEYRNKWLMNPKEFIVEDAPIHIDIEPTNVCNLKCPMCSRTVIVNNDEKNKEFKTGYLDYELYKKIIDEASQIGVYSIKLNWLGEPLLHPQIIDMIKYAKEKGIEDVMLNTNAVLLSDEISKKLIDAGLDKIFFSFDSPNKKLYEEIRVGAKFEKTLENIKRFVNIRNSENKLSPIVRVSMVLMEENKNEYSQFINLFNGIADIISYVDYIDPYNNEDNYNVNSKFKCSQLWQRLCITWDGDVLPCCNDIYREYTIGNIKESTIFELWHSKKSVAIRELHKRNEYFKCVICKKCSITSFTNDGDF